MPVSFVKPSMTDCGTYSDQAKRFSSWPTSASAGALSEAGFAAGCDSPLLATPLFTSSVVASPVFASSCEVQALNAAKRRQTAKANQNFFTTPPSDPVD